MNEPTESQKGRYRGKHVKKVEKKKHPVLRGLVIALLIVGVLAGGVYAAYRILYNKGRRAMLVYDNESLTVQIPTLPTQETDGTEETQRVLSLDDGTTVVYKGHTYRLNKRLTTILFMGVDKSIELANDTGKGGQADVVMLAAMDTETGQTTLLNLSRETYAQVEVYTMDGTFVNSQFVQLCLAYAYGNGEDTSCENTVRAVSRLLYGLPISSYLALDMNGMVKANDLLGGITVTCRGDVTLSNGRVVHDGETVELHGTDVERYLRARDSEQLESNGDRMLRHQEYMLALLKAMIAQSRNDYSFPLSLFSALSDDMTTSLSTSDVTFLSTCFLEHGANFNLRSIDGTYGLLNESAVYYLDETDLFEAVLQVFYLRED